jgi:hypothetical protein
MRQREFNVRAAHSLLLRVPPNEFYNLCLEYPLLFLGQGIFTFKSNSCLTALPNSLVVCDWREKFQSLPESYVLLSDNLCLRSKLVLVKILCIQLYMEQEHIFKQENFEE